MGNVGTESVYQIVQSGRTECFVGVSRGCLARRLYSQDTRETQLSPSVLTLHIPVMCKAHVSFRGDLASVQWSVAIGCVGYVTHVQDWTRVVYPTRPVTLVTG